MRPPIPSSLEEEEEKNSKKEKLVGEKMAQSRAWGEAVKAEEKAMLHQLLMQQRSADIGKKVAAGQPPGSVSSSVRNYCNSEVRNRIAEYNKSQVAPPVGSSVQAVRPTETSSVAPSIHSSRSTQLSHRAPSTRGGGTSVFSGLTEFSVRLEKMEQRLVEDKAERQKVHDELAEIKRLLLEQANRSQQKKE